MNILDLNNEIYGIKDLKQGEHANLKIDSIEQQEILNISLNNYKNDNIDSDFNKINKEIKF